MLSGLPVSEPSVTHHSPHRTQGQSGPWMAAWTACLPSHPPTPSQCLCLRINDDKEVFALRAWTTGHLEKHIPWLTRALPNTAGGTLVPGHPPMSSALPQTARLLQLGEARQVCAAPPPHSNFIFSTSQDSLFCSPNEKIIAS